jgi:nicotinate-nucleotide adenylyltransferase
MTADGPRPERAGAHAPTGVFGGTFNPVHVAHLRAAEEVAEALGLERMLFVPAAAPPHKQGEETDPIAPPELRLAWLRAATADNPRFAVDPIEIERGGTSFSVDTLREIAARTAPARPVFVIGWDAFREIDTWKDPATLFALADFAVMTRPPISDASLRSFLPSCIQDGARVAGDGRSAELCPAGAEHGAPGGTIRLVPVTPLDVSASDVRRRLREGRSVRYLLPERVHDAIVASGVYGPRPRGGTGPAPDAPPEDR